MKARSLLMITEHWREHLIFTSDAIQAQEIVLTNKLKQELKGHHCFVIVYVKPVSIAKKTRLRFQSRTPKIEEKRLK